MTRDELFIEALGIVLELRDIPEDKYLKFFKDEKLDAAIEMTELDGTRYYRGVLKGQRLSAYNVCGITYEGVAGRIANDIADRLCIKERRD